MPFRIKIWWWEGDRQEEEGSQERIVQQLPERFGYPVGLDTARPVDEALKRLVTILLALYCMSKGD